MICVGRRDGAELVTLWGDDTTAGGARVPRRFTDALKDSDRAVAERSDRQREHERDARGE